MAWLKLDEDINVTIRAEIITQDRAEQCELTDMMSAAKCFELMCRNRQLGATHDYLLRVSAINTCASCHHYTAAWDIVQALALVPGIDHTRSCLYNCLCPGTTPTMGTGRLTWSIQGRPVGDSPIVYRAHRDNPEGG